MEFSRLTPTEFWDQHINKLESIHSEMKQAEALLEDVREKRTNPRIRSLYLTSYIPKKGKEQDYIISIGRTLDVSEGGVKVETHRQLDKGTKLELHIAVEDEIVSAEGEVLYCEELSDGLFGTGICFTSIRKENCRLFR